MNESDTLARCQDMRFWILYRDFNLLPHERGASQHYLGLGFNANTV